MAFAYTIVKRTVFGDQNIVMGTYTNAGGDTGGAIATGLKKVNFSVAEFATAKSVSGETVTITTADGADGEFIAIGY